MAILLYPDGEKQRISPANGRFFTLDEKRRLVPGPHELIFIDEQRSALISHGCTAAYNEHGSHWLSVMTGCERKAFGSVLIFRHSEFHAGLPGEDDLALAAAEIERVNAARTPFKVEEPVADGLW